MATYIAILRYTQQGVEKIKDSPSRLDTARKNFRDFGVEIKTFYLTNGQFDALVICEAPNEEAMAKAMLSVGSKGNVRTETFRAFTEEEFRKIIGSLP